MQKRITIMGTFGIIGLGLILGILSITSRSSLSVGAQKPCPVDLIEIVDPVEQERCVQEKEQNLILRYESLSHTAEANTANNNLPPTANPTYGTAIPENIIPFSHGEDIHQVPYAEFEGYWFFSDKDSIWYIGHAPHVEYSYSQLYAWTARSNDEHSAQMGLHMPSGGLAAYDRVWDLPREITSITIIGTRDLDTSGEKPIGVLIFITSDGTTGELDFVEGIRLLP